MTATMQPETEVAQAVDLLAHALGAYERAGDLRQAARLRATLRQLGHDDPTRGDVGDDPWQVLTASELRVACLVADGLSNKQIAYHLHLSRHTVESHLRNVFAKLSLTSRAQLAARLTATRAG